MRLAVLALALSAALAPGLARGAPPPAAVAAAGALASDVGAPPEGRRALRLQVEGPTPSLARTLETALDAALSAKGYAVTPHRGPEEAEAAARAAGEDWLLRVRAGLVPGGGEVALVGDLIPAWASFFQQRRPEARAIPPRVVQARAPVDPETRLLAREERRAGAPFAAVRALGQLPGRVLAVAIGDAEARGRPAIAVVTPDLVAVLAPDGTPVAVRHASREGAAPVRDPAATIAIGAFGGGRIALRRAGVAASEVLAVRDGALEPAGALEAAPLCAGGAGPLFGAFAAGTGVLVDALSRRPDAAPAPRSPRLLYGAAAAPGGGPLSYAVLGTDLALALLGADLAPVRATAPAAALATGSGFALADLDGDGTAELVASAPASGAPDRLRIVAPLARTPLLLEASVEGEILAAAGGDLTGDGVDDAVAAAVAAGADGAPTTTLLLVTADPREAR
jgi:hypothetical protein